MSKISVAYIVFTYNQEQYVECAITSALEQTYDNLHIIISDDCSDDGTRNLISKQVRGYDGPHRVSVNFNKKNMGVVPHINSVLKNLTEDVVILAAGDDESFPGRTDHVCECFQKYKCSAVYVSANKVDEHGRRLGGITYKDSKLTKQDFPMEWPRYYGAGAAYSRDIIKKYGNLPEIVRNEDTNLMWRAFFTNGIHYTNRVLLNYRMHENNLSFSRLISSASNNRTQCTLQMRRCSNNIRNHLIVLRYSNMRWRFMLIKFIGTSVIKWGYYGAMRMMK